MPNNIIMQVKVDDKLIVLHPETTASQVKLASGKTLQEYIDEHDVVKVENGRLYRKTENGSYEIVSSVTSEFNLEPATGVSFESVENRVAVKWTDPLDVTIESSTGPIALATWAGTKLVAKVGSPPTNMNDGITLVDSKVRDQYKATAYLGTLDMNKTYYLKLFPYTDTGIDTTVGDSLSTTTTNIILDEPTASAVAVDDKAYLTWTDPVDKTASFNGSTVNTAKWLKTVVVKKVGSSPANINDGDIVTEVTTKNLHTTNPFIVSGLAEGLTYFKFFPVTTDGDVTTASSSQFPVTVSHGTLPVIENLSVVRRGTGSDITWTDPVEPTTTVGGLTVKTATWAKTVVVMRVGAIPVNINDSNTIKIKETTVYNQHETVALNVPSIPEDTLVYFRAFTVCTNGKIISGYPKSIRIDSVPLPAELGPGPSRLFGGDATAGFFGEVLGTDFIDPASLATQVGVTQGTHITEVKRWLKFILDGKILFVCKALAKKSVSWDHLSAVGVVNGNKIIKIGDNYYKVRLMKGLVADNTAYTNTKGSEWNRLMLPIHIQAKDKSWTHPDNVEADVPYWGSDYTDADLYCDSNNTSRSWCQEKVTNGSTGKSIRGLTGVSSTGWYDSNSNTSNFGWRPVLELVPSTEIKDLSGSPGSSVLLKGDTAAGYFGEVKPSELISGSSLSNQIGLTGGTTQFDTEGWLKFNIDGKIIFVAKKPFKHSITWSQINAVGAALGTKTISINGLTYKVRLMKGAQNNPSNNGDSDRDAIGSEWNRLMLPIHEQAKTKAWSVPAYAGTDVPDWGIGFNDADLLTHNNYGNGSYTWCQETVANDSASRVIRSLGGVSGSNWTPSTSGNTTYGWRPVLELI